MSYSLLGTSCIPHILACTSNHKFLPLRAPVYKKQHTYMMQYPGNSTLSDNLTRIMPEHEGHNHPEIIKSYYGKIWEHENTSAKHKQEAKAKQSPPERMSKACTNC